MSATRGFNVIIPRRNPTLNTQVFTSFSIRFIFYERYDLLFPRAKEVRRSNDPKSRPSGRNDTPRDECNRTDGGKFTTVLRRI